MVRSNAIARRNRRQSAQQLPVVSLPPPPRPHESLPRGNTPPRLRDSVLWPRAVVVALAMTFASVLLRDRSTVSIARAPRAVSGRAVALARSFGGPFRGLRGTVRTIGGRVVVGARVEAVLVLEGRTYPLATSNSESDGAFVLESLPEGSYWVLARADGFARAAQLVRLHGHDVRDVALRLGPSASIVGQVTLPARNVVSGAAQPAGLIVRASPDSGGEGPPFAARVDSQGRFAIEGLPPGTYRVELAQEGYEAIVRRAIPAPSRGLSFELRALAIVRGVAQDVSGRPIAGVDITFAGSGVWPPRATHSTADGTFQIVGIPGGVYELRGRNGDDVAEPVAPLVLEPGDARDVRLVLSAGATMEGAVIDAVTQRPLAQARVVVTEDALATAPRAIVADAQGHFRVQGLLRRVHQVSATADGYVPRVGALAMPGAAPVTVALDREVIVTGRVVDARGAPIAGAQVEVSATDLDGRVSLLNASAVAFRESLFRAQAAGPRPLIRAGELGVMPGPIPLLPLTAGGSPAAMLVGQPASGLAYVTDAAGRFRVGSIPPGVVLLSAAHPAYVRGETTQRPARAGETLEVEIILFEGGTIDGRLVDEAGFPMPSQLIEIRSVHDLYPRRMFTSRDGTFRAPSLLGRVAIVALAGRHTMARVEVDVADGAIVPVTLTLDRNVRRARGRVLDAHGFPVAGAEIALSTPGAATGATRTISQADGTFDTLIAAGGEVEIEVRHPRNAPHTIRVRDLSADVQIALESGGALVVRTRADGCTVEPVAFEIRTTCGPLRRTAAAGTEVRLEHVCPGRVQIVASAAGCVPASRSATVADEQTTEAAVLELGSGGGAQGEVVDGRNQPVPGAFVALPDTAPDAVSGTARSDRRGLFSIRDLPDGDHVLVALHSILGRSHTAAVRVFHGSVARGVRLVFDGDLDRAQSSEIEGPIGLAMRGSDVVVVHVAAESAPSRAGLQPADALVQINGTVIRDVAGARRALAGPRGDEIAATVRRDSVERTVRWQRLD